MGAVLKGLSFGLVYCAYTWLVLDPVPAILKNCLLKNHGNNQVPELPTEKHKKNSQSHFAGAKCVVREYRRLRKNTV